ncbi:putative WD40/YVTN repeat-like-containing domain superfamily [Helianthus debilis subsp. tardiflorus]
MKHNRHNEHIKLELAYRFSRRLYLPRPLERRAPDSIRQRIFKVFLVVLTLVLAVLAIKDYIVVGSDSGRIVILDYNKEKNVFDQIHQETFGKYGSRRIVPGQYLAIDPKGRAVMIAACEKQKLVYTFSTPRSFGSSFATSARLTISSPLEAHKSHTITYSIAGVDCGFDNPIFAAIELDYSEADQDSTGQAANEAQKVLTFYELDLGLNHVSRKWSEQVDNEANMLVTVPGGERICRLNDECDAFIVVSFANATLVLSIGETVEEVSDSGFLDTTPSLAVSLIGDDSLMQVHPSGIRHIREDGRVNVWRTPGKRTIVKVGYNRLQVVVALSGGEIIYFEVDMTGQLMEVEKNEMSGDVACLDIARIPEGR